MVGSLSNRQINAVGLEHLLTAAEREGRLRRWIQISSLGVYPARDHFGTDETVAPSLTGLDGYTRTKAEAEVLLRRHIDEYQLPAVILRPGFTYGPGERAVIPRLIKRFEQGVVKFIGDGQKVLNNTYVGNFVEAVMLAIVNDGAVGETFNIRDQRLVTREEYLTLVAQYLGKPRPKHVHATDEGLFDRPTCLNNVKTWATVPHIINNGPIWFRRYQP